MTTPGTGTSTLPFVFSWFASSPTTHTENVSHSLALVQTAAEKGEEVSHTLGIEHEVFEFNFVADRQVVADTLSLTQTLLALQDAPISQSLGLTDSVSVQAPYNLLVTHWLSISQHLATPFFLSVEDTLTLSQMLPAPIAASGNNTLNLIDVASMSNIVDTLNLTHTASAGKLYEIEHSLNITDSHVLTSNFVRSLTQNLGVGHALTWFRDDACDRKNYTPFQGEQTVNTDFPQPPASLPSTPYNPQTDRLVLYYPSIDAIARQVTLRAPEFQDRDRNSYTRVTRETRGGSLIVYADPEWPSLRNIAVTVQGLTSTEADEYIAFMYATLGKKIQVRDWEGGLWEGVIINPENPVTQDGPGCKYTISFELEGLKFETDNWTEEADMDGFVLHLEDEATAVIV